jgi:peptide/nickel transport system permease protein
MRRYVVRRVLSGILLLFIVSAVAFIIFYAFPSADPAVLRAGRGANEAQIERIRESLGLDEPIFVQYWIYMKNIILHGDFGYSYQFNTPVLELIKDRLPATISLVAGAAVIWLLVGIPTGIISAIRQRSLLDRATMLTTLTLISAPVFWLGLVVLYLFDQDIGRFPILPGLDAYVPLTNDPIAWAEALILPWLVLASATAAIYARYMRSGLIDVMSEDYIRTARAKGVAERQVVLKHGVRSAITPIITLLGLDLGILIAGNAILTETVFVIPGVGKLVPDAIEAADLPLIQGLVIIGAFFIITFNLIVDIIYAYLDPRVRY